MAERLGQIAESLLRLVGQAERDIAVPPGLTADERVRLKERANEILHDCVGHWLNGRATGAGSDWS